MPRPTNGTPSAFLLNLRSYSRTLYISYQECTLPCLIHLCGGWCTYPIVINGGCRKHCIRDAQSCFSQLHVANAHSAELSRAAPRSLGRSHVNNASIQSCSALAGASFNSVRRLLLHPSAAEEKKTCPVLSFFVVHSWHRFFTRRCRDYLDVCEVQLEFRQYYRSTVQ